MSQGHGPWRSAWFAGNPECVGPFIALTDKAWFDYHAASRGDRRVDEVNFWSPKSTDPLKAMAPGTPVFLRLKHPWNAIAGYGFFAHHGVHSLDEAWRLFTTGNGDANQAAFLIRLG